MNCYHITEEELQYYGVWSLTNKLILMQKSVQHPKLLSQANTLGVPGSWQGLFPLYNFAPFSFSKRRQKSSIKTVLAYNVERISILSPGLSGSKICQCCHIVLLSTALFRTTYFQPLRTKVDSHIKEFLSLIKATAKCKHVWFIVG